MNIESITHKYQNYKSIILPILTILSITSVYYYELGFCAYYRIPSTFISIEITKYVYLIPIFAGTIVILTFCLTPYVYPFQKIPNSNTNKRQRIILRNIGYTVAIAALLGVGYALTKNIYSIDLMFLLILLTYGIFVNSVAYTDEPSPTPEPIEIKEFFDTIFLRKYGNVVGNKIVMSVLILMIFYFLGNTSAYRNRRHYIKPDKKTVLIKKYQDVTIWGTISNDTLQNLIFDDGGNNPDTIVFTITNVRSKPHSDVQRF